VVGIDPQQSRPFCGLGAGDLCDGHALSYP
jgi:hypothetical protein